MDEISIYLPSNYAAMPPDVKDSIFKDAFGNMESSARLSDHNIQNKKRQSTSLYDMTYISLYSNYFSPAHKAARMQE